MRCGLCGKALVGQEAKGGKYAYYVCGTLLKQGAGTCSCRYINSSKFEQLVIQKINEVILDQRNLEELVRLTNEELANQTDVFRSDLKLVDSELVSVKHRLDNLYDALETKLLDLSDLAPRIKQLKQRKEMLQLNKQDIDDMLANKRVGLINLQMMTKYAVDLKQLIAESSIEEQKAFIRGFVKEIKVTKNKVVIIYIMPLPSS